MNGETFPDSERWIKVLRGSHGRREWDDAGKPNDDNVSSIFIGNLSWTVEEQHVRDCFANCGEILSVRFSTDRETGHVPGLRPRRLRQSRRRHGRRRVGRRLVDNRQIRVDYAKPKPPRDARGSGGGGGYSPRGAAAGGARAAAAGAAAQVAGARAPARAAARRSNGARAPSRRRRARRRRSTSVVPPPIPPLPPRTAPALLLFC